MFFADIKHTTVVPNQAVGAPAPAAIDASARKFGRLMHTSNDGPMQGPQDTICDGYTTDSAGEKRSFCATVSLVSMRF